jgi:L-threonylcarbamoyladenylate synthase
MAEINNNIQLAQEQLKAGQLVAIPTETVYGLAANALDAEAVAKIFEAKNRPTFDPLIVHIPYPSDVEKYAAAYPGPARDLAMTFWPGPLTLLLPSARIFRISLLQGSIRLACVARIIRSRWPCCDNSIFR